MTEEQKSKVIALIIQLIESSGSASVNWAIRQHLFKSGKSEVEKVSAKICESGKYIRTPNGENDYYISKNPNYKTPNWTERKPVLYDVVKGLITAIFSIVVALLLSTKGCLSCNQSYMKLEKRVDSLKMTIDSLKQK